MFPSVGIAAKVAKRPRRGQEAPRGTAKSAAGETQRAEVRAGKGFALMEHARRLSRTSTVLALVLSVLASLVLIGPGRAAEAPATAGAGAGIMYEAENAATGGTRVADSSASGGAMLRGRRIEAVSSLTSGTYRLRARVRHGSGARVDLLGAGKMVGTYAISGGWRVVDAVMRINSGETFGVGTYPTSGPSLDVDWFALEAVPSAYTVRGSDVLSLSGTAARFRGINVRSAHAPRSNNGTLILPVSQAMDLYVWGADSVRLAINQEHWLANCPARTGGTLTNYRAAVAHDVRELTNRGVYVLITLAIVERGRNTGCTESSKPLLKEMADNRSIGLWSSVAQTFRTNPRVAFDLFNEPHDISDHLWRNGGQVTYTTTVRGMKRTKTYDAVGMQRLYDTVRSTGATNVVVVSGQRWAADPRVALSRTLDGYGIVLGTHIYCGRCPLGSPALPYNVDRNNSPEVRARFPVVVTEGGWTTQTNSSYNRDLINWSEARGMGWMLYAFMQPARYSLVREFENTFDAGKGYRTKPPAVSGAPVWNAFAPMRVARGYLARPLSES
jgi:hypothetical protein